MLLSNLLSGIKRTEINRNIFMNKDWGAICVNDTFLYNEGMTIKLFIPKIVFDPELGKGQEIRILLNEKMNCPQLVLLMMLMKI